MDAIHIHRSPGSMHATVMTLGFLVCAASLLADGREWNDEAQRPAGDAAFPCPANHCWCSDWVSNASIRVQRDVSYATAFNRLTHRQETLRLDAYVPPIDPALAGEHLRPVALLIHGGGWHPSGEFSGKSSPGIVERAMAFARRGFVAVAIDYRCERPYGGTALWVDATADGRSALRWLNSSQAAFLQVDPLRVVAYGTSAGAVTVAGLCYMNDAQPSSHPPLASGISVSGCLFNDTTSLPPGGRVWNHLYSGKSSSPPYIDFHGTADPVVPFSNASQRPASEGRRNQSCSATDTRAYLLASGASNFLAPIPGAGHVPIAMLYEAPYNVSLWGFVLATLHPTPGVCPGRHPGT